MFTETALFLAIAGTAAMIIIIIVSKFKLTFEERFKLFVSSLGGMSVLLMSYNIFITIRSNKKIEHNRTAYDTLQNIRESYLLPQKGLLLCYPEGYFLYASMNQDTDLSGMEPQHYDAPKRKQVEVYYSLRVFQAIEDFLSTAHYDLSGIYSWINTFLMWMQSPILQHQWSLLNFNYAHDTRALVNRIIEKSNGLIELRKQKGQLVTEDYDAISRNFKVQTRE